MTANPVCIIEISKNPIKFSSFKNSEFNCTQYGILSIEYHVTNANEISKEIKTACF